jgi:hypothetical protein
MRCHLLTGAFPEGAFPGWLEPFVTPSDQQAALWRAHRDELLADWIREHAGSRPWSWWRWEALEPRRVVAHAELLMPVRSGSTDWQFWWHESLGVPAFQQCRPRGFEGDPAIESQAAYLDRFGLLADAERDALPPDAWDPEIIDPFLVDEGEVEELIAQGTARTRTMPRNGHVSHSTPTPEENEEEDY